MRMVVLLGNSVDMLVGNGVVGMVDCDVFDEWLCVRVVFVGVVWIIGMFEWIDCDLDGVVCVVWCEECGGFELSVWVWMVIGVDGVCLGVVW